MICMWEEQNLKREPMERQSDTHTHVSTKALF